MLWHTTVDELSTLLSWGAILVVVLVVSLQAYGLDVPSARELLGALAALVLLGGGLRVIARTLWRQSTRPERIVLIGSGAVLEAFKRKFEIFRDFHGTVVGTIGENELAWSAGRLERLGPDVDRIVLASEHVDERLIAELIPFCRTHQIKLGLIPPARGMFGTAVVLDHLAELPVVQYNTWDTSRTTLVAKRLIDVIIAGILVVGCLALLPFVALAIKLDSPGPIFFRQRRAGRHGASFAMLKFRSMSLDAEHRLGDVLQLSELETPVFKVRDDPRVTRVGKVLRRLSLDELPQLYNVLRGDMSLVGPRPEQIELVSRYAPEVRAIRLALRPGLTGPMQVFGRGELTFEERLAVEREYVDNLSLSRDLRILGRTLTAVTTARGAF